MKNKTRCNFRKKMVKITKGTFGSLSGSKWQRQSQDSSWQSVYTLTWPLPCFALLLTTCLKVNFLTFLRLSFIIYKMRANMVDCSIINTPLPAGRLPPTCQSQVGLCNLLWSIKHEQKRNESLLGRGFRSQEWFTMPSSPMPCSFSLGLRLKLQLTIDGHVVWVRNNSLL